MKKLLLVFLATLSLQSMAATSEYTGSNNGAACSVRVDLSQDYVSMGGIGLLARNKTTKGNVQILEGGADFEDAKITLNFNSNKELSSAKLETRNMLIPFYRTKLVCMDLIKTK
ncbi:MAG: hypothetical protein PHY93_21365 [Bacteriovorax sp.]|nr:hypothetical protein [Bacteriovorax sp.]